MTHEPLKTLKDAGLKNTPARKRILDVFSAGCGPINAEHIHEQLAGSRINQVTIYRNLAALEKAGIINQVDLRKGSAYYELAGHHHHHIVCTECGKTEGFELCAVKEMSKKALERSSLFDAIDRHSLELFGLCKSCSKG